MPVGYYGAWFAWWKGPKFQYAEFLEQFVEAFSPLVVLLRFIDTHADIHGPAYRFVLFTQKTINFLDKALCVRFLSTILVRHWTH